MVNQSIFVGTQQGSVSGPLAVTVRVFRVL